jgi:hypothetical protein
MKRRNFIKKALVLTGLIFFPINLFRSRKKLKVVYVNDPVLVQYNTIVGHNQYERGASVIGIMPGYNTEDVVYEIKAKWNDDNATIKSIGGYACYRDLPGEGPVFTELRVKISAYKKYMLEEPGAHSVVYNSFLKKGVFPEEPVRNYAKYCAFSLGRPRKEFSYLSSREINRTISDFMTGKKDPYAS